MTTNESHASQTIKHHRNMVLLMVVTPLLVMSLVAVALISTNQRSKDTQAAVNSAPTTNYQPANGKVYSGVRAKDKTVYNDFLSRTGQPSVALYHTYRNYTETNKSFNQSLNNLTPSVAGDAVPMISWTLFNGEYCYTGTDACRPGSTNGSIARGALDQYIMDRSTEIRNYKKPVFLRINWEMNGHWFAFSSYKPDCMTSDCTQKKDNEVEKYKDVWRRVAIIFDGGTKDEINARLAAQGMPGLTTSATSLSATNNVALVWNASQSGKSEVTQYYPGDEFVDWVGIDWYAKGTENFLDPGTSNTVFSVQQKNPDLVYNSFSGPKSSGKKPYMVGEWGMWGLKNKPDPDGDNPVWMGKFLDWAEARPQVKALVYFNADTDKVNHELSRYPNAAKVYKERLASSRYLKKGSDVVTVIPPPPPPPTSKPVVTLTASKTSIEKGQSTIITWSATNNPTNCTASGDWSGTKSASGSQTSGALNTVKTYTYTLACSNTAGSDSKSVSVTVTATPPPPPKPVISLKVTPATVNLGQSTTITWSATNNPTCTASGDWSGSKPASGSQTSGALNTIKTYSYKLTCINAGGSTEATVSALVLPPKPVVSLSLASSTISSGQSTTITWSATNNPTCTASGDWSGTKSASGSESTGTQTQSRTYTLTCSNAGGSGTASVALSVDPVNPGKPKPVVTLTAEPSNVQFNKKAKLTWNATNNPSCKASGNWSGDKPASGSEETPGLTEGATYTLTCSNDGGSGATSVSVTVVKISDTTGKVTVNTGNGGNPGSGTPATEIEVPGLTVENPYIVGEVTVDPLAEATVGEAETTQQFDELSASDIATETGTVIISAGPIQDVAIPKPVAYTFLIAGGVSIVGLGSYLAITKLTIFAGIRGRWGL